MRGGCIADRGSCGTGFDSASGSVRTKKFRTKGSELADRKGEKNKAMPRAPSIRCSSIDEALSFSSRAQHPKEQSSSFFQGKAAHKKGLARQKSGSFANEVQNQQGFVERRECTTGAQPHFFVGEIEWSSSRSSRQRKKEKFLYSLFVLRHYGFGVDPGNKEGIHKKKGSNTMIKYYPHD
ncbi:uncharacterized protein LOC120110592 [Phoenix dactylifera]|uniref:Uncharacterized protein LOC120110592 n=1 Tax=Phoenix dactylifera TaxID=42345 RepID=A0A8B9ADD3_PHODC|nr:uncharacterized protein LOC120110592 [Phoenix dactylifera]